MAEVGIGLPAPGPPAPGPRPQPAPPRPGARRRKPPIRQDSSSALSSPTVFPWAALEPEPEDWPRDLRPSPRRRPPGVDPAVYGWREVVQGLRRVAIFPMFSLPSLGGLNRPIFDGRRMVGIAIQESLHPFEIDSRRRNGRLVSANLVGPARSAEVRVRLLPVPAGFVPAPGLEPPPTPFSLQRPQRFVLTDGRFHFEDPQKSGFLGFGVGSTYPAVFGAKPVLRIGGVVRILEGFGALSGFSGMVMVNGSVQPPFSMQLSVTPCFVDPEEELRSQKRIERAAPLPNPDPEGTYLIFGAEHLPAKAEGLPANEVPALPLAPGMIFLPSRAPIRHLRIESNLQDLRSGPPRSSLMIGDVVGEMSAEFWLGPLGGEGPIAFQSRQEAFTLHSETGAALGRLLVDSTHGRAFEIPPPGIAKQAWIGTTIGPITRGQGIFEGVQGFVSCLATLSLYPRVLSICYVVRLTDPDGIYRAAAERALGVQRGYGDA